MILLETDSIRQLINKLSQRLDDALAAKNAASEELTATMAEIKTLTGAVSSDSGRAYFAAYLDAIKEPTGGFTVKQIVKDVFTGHRPQLSVDKITALSARLSNAEKTLGDCVGKYQAAKLLYNQIQEIIQT